MQSTGAVLKMGQRAACFGIVLFQDVLMETVFSAWSWPRLGRQPLETMETALFGSVAG